MNHSEKEDKFKTIISHHQDQIQRICSGFTTNVEDIKDLYQDVIINIWKGMESFRGDASYATWIHRITINCCLLWKRKSKVQVSKNDAIELSNQNRIQNDVSVDNPQLQLLKEAINQLKSSDKALILLVLEELTYKQIAEITGLSISNIGVKINRIKSKLKNYLENK